MNKETSNIIIGIISFFFFFLIVLFLVFVVILRYRKRVKENEQNQSQFAQTLLQSQLEIREQTLEQISQELHDNLGQVASLIKINLNTLRLDDPKAIEKIDNTKELCRQLIADLKALSVSLSGDRIISSGLVCALEKETERLNKTGQFDAKFNLVGEFPALEADKSVIVYRMAQEILNNIVKHSQAKHIGILVTIKENFLILAITDDGIGFDAKERMNSGGAGLQNLYKRASLIKAEFSIQSSPSVGTDVRITLSL